MLFKDLYTSVLTISAIILITACSEVKQDAKIVEKNNTISELYEVHEDERVYAFYDRALYKQFLSVGETAYRLTRIGTGPNGETMVFGLTKADKKKGVETPAVKLFDNLIKPAEDFYAEMVRHGRIYVFNNFDDMQPVRQFGHPNFFYMEVGNGPNGETVVYVLNSSNKKKKPEALISEFKSRN